MQWCHFRSNQSHQLAGTRKVFRTPQNYSKGNKRWTQQKGFHILLGCQGGYVGMHAVPFLQFKFCQWKLRMSMEHPESLPMAWFVEIAYEYGTSRITTNGLVCVDSVCFYLSPPTLPTIGRLSLPVSFVPSSYLHSVSAMKQDLCRLLVFSLSTQLLVLAYIDIR